MSGREYALHRPVLGAEEAAAVAEVLASGYLVNGPRVAAFERGVADRLSLAHGVACSSGTAALHLALRAMGCGPGDEVIVPAFGFPATANAVELCGARAALADISLDTFGLTAATVEAARTPRTVGVLPVHPFGIPAPMEELERHAEGHGLWIVEDAACALGTSNSDGRWGSGRHPVCLSFHPRKTLTTGEGGMVLTEDADLAATLRCLRNHGMAADGRAGWLRFEEAGFNYRLTDVAGAIGLVQLSRLDEIIGARRRVAGWYREQLAGLAGVDVPSGYAMSEQSYQSFVVLLSSAGRDRDSVIEALGARQIRTTIGGYGLVRQPYYSRRYALDPAALPAAETAAMCSLTLPVTGDMEEADVAHVVAALAEELRS